MVAHEISHSWTGNVVTNATWEHFWLNEGWTRWLEDKILEKKISEDAFGGAGGGAAGAANDAVRKFYEGIGVTDKRGVEKEVGKVERTIGLASWRSSV